MISSKKPVHWWQQLNQWANGHEWLLLLITFMVVLRLPSLFEPFWYGDENIYLAIGQGLRYGQVLYQDITDYPNKPPMIYWLAALVETVPRFRFLLLLWSIPGVIYFYKLVNKVYQSTVVSFFATLAFVYLTATPILEGTIANAEIFFIVPTIMAIYWIYPDKKSSLPLWRYILSGLLMGVALLFKIHVLLDVMFIGLFFFIFPIKLRVNNLIKLCLDPKPWLFVLGILIPLLLATIWLGFRGVRPASLVTNAASSSSYTAVWDDAQRLKQTLGMGSLQARSFALGIILLGLYLFRFKLDQKTLFVVLWLVLSIFAALLSARPYPHYLIQIVPAVILASSLFFSRLKPMNYMVLFGSLSLVFAAYWRFNFYLWPVKTYYRNFIAYVSQQIDTNEYYRRFDRRMPRNYALAQTIRQNSGVNDQIYIWGTEPGVYVLSRRSQAGPLVVSFHVEDLDYYDETMIYVKQNPPELMVVMEPEWRDFPQLDAFIAAEYILVEVIGDPDKNAYENRDFNARVYRRAEFL